MKNTISRIPSYTTSMPKSWLQVKSCYFKYLWKWKKKREGKEGLGHRRKSGKIGLSPEKSDSLVGGEENHQMIYPSPHPWRILIYQAKPDSPQNEIDLLHFF